MLMRTILNSKRSLSFFRYKNKWGERETLIWRGLEVRLRKRLPLRETPHSLMTVASLQGQRILQCPGSRERTAVTGRVDALTTFTEALFIAGGFADRMRHRAAPGVQTAPQSVPVR